MAKALIVGATGQDGAYLSRLLLDKRYDVIGTTRGTTEHNQRNLREVNALGAIQLLQLDPLDKEAVTALVATVRPDQIYNLSGQSSVGASFDQPVATFNSIASGTINFLEAIRVVSRDIRFYNACSSESFGDTPIPADENTPFAPRSPYGIAKTAAFHCVRTYREAYGLNVCSGILFNHESPLRGDQFVTSKIVRTAVEIARGKDVRLELGNVDSVRDWGWAPDYVDAMWRMLQINKVDDFVIASGYHCSIGQFVEAVFACLGLEPSRHVTTRPALLRPHDIYRSLGNPHKARVVLGWQATTSFQQMIAKLVEASERRIAEAER